MISMWHPVGRDPGGTGKRHLGLPFWNPRRRSRTNPSTLQPVPVPVPVSQIGQVTGNSWIEPRKITGNSWLESGKITRDCFFEIPGDVPGQTILLFSQSRFRSRSVNLVKCHMLILIYPVDHIITSIYAKIYPVFLIIACVSWYTL